MEKPSSPAAEVTAQMLIRVPADRAFTAFIDPAVTTKFWFTQGSGPLVAGQTVTWQWEMYQLSADVIVDEIFSNAKIAIRWDEPLCPVVWEFEKRTEDQTLVKITTHALGEPHELMSKALDLKGGFTMVLAGAKAWLEHGVQFNLVADQFPNGCPEYDERRSQ